MFAIKISARYTPLSKKNPSAPLVPRDSPMARGGVANVKVKGRETRGATGYRLPYARYRRPPRSAIHDQSTARALRSGCDLPFMRYIRQDTGEAASQSAIGFESGATSCFLGAGFGLASSYRY
jgi:hypothetical protein